mgnify:FL=1
MKALVIGGSSGIGLSMVLNLISRKDIELVYVLDKQAFPKQYYTKKVQAVLCNLANANTDTILSKLDTIQYLYITAGFGHLHYFQELSSKYIDDSFYVNTCLLYTSDAADE